MKKAYIILSMAAALFVACNSDSDELTPANNTERVPLRIAAGIDVQAEAETRAVETAWEENDKIGVFITERNSTEVFKEGEGESVVKAENLEYTFDDGTNYETYGNTYRVFTPTTKIYLPSRSVDVYGYYPYKTTISDPTAIPVNVGTQTNQKAIDFMRAKTGNVSNSNAVVELLFQHKLVKLVFNLKQGEGLLPDELKQAIYLDMTLDNQHTEVNYNIYTDAFSITNADYSTIRPVRASSAPTGFVRTFEAIVLPNGVGNRAQDRTVTITFYQKANDQIVNTFKIPESVVFNSGYKYTYNVTVNATSIQVDPLKYTEQW